MTKRRSEGMAALADKHVGIKIRDRRSMLGLTQQQLAQMIGVTYQQAHKYEHGINRVSAGRLFEIARVLNAPVSYFFEGFSETQPPVHPDEHSRARLNIGNMIAGITNPEKLNAIITVVRAISA